VYDPEIGLRLIAYEGQTIEVSPGVQRVVERVWTTAGSSGSFSRGGTRIFSDAGDMMVGIEFEDDSVGVFLANVNSPVTIRPRTIAFTDFNEPPANAGTYVPGLEANELGFSTTTNNTGGISPFAGVVKPSPSAGLLRHRSTSATTTFSPVDLSRWTGVEVSLSIFVATGTSYEAGDFVRARVTIGIEIIDLTELLGDATQADDLDVESAVGMRRVYSAMIPDDWQTARLIVASSSNSSQAAEYFDIDEVRFVGVPEPSGMVLGAIAFVLLAFTASRRGRRRLR
jgi:hypothetical protein